MKRKIFITFFIIISIFGFHYSKVFAETNIKETISCRFPNYDVTAEHKLEIKNNKDTKIVVIFKDMTIIESYVENNNGKMDLKSLSRITYETKKAIQNMSNFISVQKFKSQDNLTPDQVKTIENYDKQVSLAIANYQNSQNNNRTVENDLDV